MCKVFGVAGLDQTNRGDAIELFKLVADKMQRVEKDGFGYSAITENGDLFGEKWLKPDDVFKKRIKRKAKPAKEVIPKLDKPVIEKFGDYLENYKKVIKKPSLPVYDNFGKVEWGNACAIIGHSRYGTGAPVTIENVHPFVNHGTALVHNGIVYNHNDPIFVKNISECDSEIMLNQYNNHLVQTDTRNLQEALRPVDAYFACLTLTKALVDDKKLVPVMDIFKHNADLDVVYVHDLDLFMFCTDGSIIVDVCKQLKYSTSRPCNITDDFILRINAVTGELIETMYFEYNSKDTFDNSETYLKSRYGENWQDHVNDYDDVPDHKEYANEKDIDEPAYRSAKESAKVFVEKDGDLMDISDWEPFDDGSDYLLDDMQDANDIIVQEEQLKELEEKWSKHRDIGVRHAK